MANISGIQFKNNAIGKPTHVLIDLRKHGADLEDFLDGSTIENAKKHGEFMDWNEAKKKLDRHHKIK